MNKFFAIIGLLFFGFILGVNTDALVNKAPVAPKSAIAIRLCGDALGFLLLNSDGTTRLLDVDNDADLAIVKGLKPEDRRTMNYEPIGGCPKQPLST